MIKSTPTQENPERNSSFAITARVVTSEYFEERTTQYAATTKLFSSNLSFDFLVFLSINSDIKIINVRNGEYIGDIEGAHFKGPTNYGLIVNSGPTSRLTETLLSIEKVVENKEPNYEDDEDPEELDVNDELLELFVEQLDDFILLSTSSKDKMRMWKFENGSSSMISQVNSLGGICDNSISVLRSTRNEILVLGYGNCSNKVEIFKLKNN